MLQLSQNNQQCLYRHTHYRCQQSTSNRRFHRGCKLLCDAVDRLLRSCWRTLRLRTFLFSISIVWSDGNQPRFPSRIRSPSSQPTKPATWYKTSV